MKTHLPFQYVRMQIDNKLGHFIIGKVSAIQCPIYQCAPLKFTLFRNELQVDSVRAVGVPQYHVFVEGQHQDLMLQEEGVRYHLQVKLIKTRTRVWDLKRCSNRLFSGVLMLPYYNVDPI